MIGITWAACMFSMIVAFFFGKLRRLCLVRNGFGRAQWKRNRTTEIGRTWSSNMNFGPRAKTCWNRGLRADGRYIKNTLDENGIIPLFYDTSQNCLIENYTCFSLNTRRGCWKKSYSISWNDSLKISVVWRWSRYEPATKEGAFSIRVGKRFRSNELSWN